MLKRHQSGWGMLKAYKSVGGLGMDTKKLRYFYAVYSLGSMRAASDELDVEQSVISRQIKALEKEIDISLFKRVGRGLVKTDAAKILAEYTEQRIREENIILKRMHQVEKRVLEKITVLSGEGYISALLSQLFSKDNERFEGRISLKLMNMQKLIDSLLKNISYIGMAYGLGVQLDLKVLADKQDPAYVVFSAEHPLAGINCDAVPFISLQKYKVATMTKGFGYRMLLDRALKAENVGFEIGFETNSLAALKEYLQLGLGVGFLRTLDVERELSTGKLCALPTDSKELNEAKTQLVVNKKFDADDNTQRILQELISSQIFKI